MARQITEDEVEIFNFLNDLRESGVTNMLGATPFIEEHFDIPKDQARKALTLWMSNFREDGQYSGIDV